MTVLFINTRKLLMAFAVITFYVTSRLEKVLQSDEAKTMLDDVFAAGNVSSISEPENVNQISELNQISRDEINTLQATNQIVPSDCSSTLEEKSQVNLTVTNETHSPNPSDDILTSSGESDIDRKVSHQNIHKISKSYVFSFPQSRTTDCNFHCSRKTENTIQICRRVLGAVNDKWTVK